MTRVRRTRFKSAPAPAVAKKRFDYTEPEPPEGDAKATPKTTARKAATKK